MHHAGTDRRAAWRIVAAATLLALWAPAWSHAGWPVEQQFGPIQVHANFRLEPYETLLADLAELQVDLVDTLGVPPAREPIHLYLFARESTYRRYLAKYVPEAPRRKAVYVKRNGPGMIFAYVSPALAIDLRHETTHAYLHAALPMLPLWLDEGLAEYFELPANQRSHGNAYLTPLRWSCRFGWGPRLASLESQSDPAAMTAGDYRDAWAWVHYALHGSPRARAQLKEYLADIAARRPPGKLSQRLMQAEPDAAARLRTHFTNWGN